MYVLYIYLINIYTVHTLNIFATGEDNIKAKEVQPLVIHVDLFYVDLIVVYINGKIAKMDVESIENLLGGVYLVFGDGYLGGY